MNFFSFLVQLYYHFEFLPHLRKVFIWQIKTCLRCGKLLTQLKSLGDH